VSFAQADLIAVDNEADFLSLVGDVTREGFESLPSDNDCTGGGSSITTDLFTATSSPQGSDASWLCIGTTAAGLPGPTEGSNALIAGGGGNDGWVLSFALTAEVYGVYFELTDAVERGDALISIDGSDPFLFAAKGTGGLQTVRFGIISDDPFAEFSLINTGFFDGWGVDNMIFASVPEPVTIDIKPGKTPNSINPAGKQKIPVAILGTDTFDATQVEWETVLFGPDGATESHGRAHVKDADGDGDKDLLLHFNTQETGIQCGDTEATLTGETFGGEFITGSDSIVTVTCD